MKEIDYRDYMENEYKVYIDVLEVRKKDGVLLPRAFRWEDGHTYRIDRVLGFAPAASLKGGDIGIKYKVIIEGKEKDMWLEENKWFMVKKSV